MNEVLTRSVEKQNKARAILAELDLPGRWRRVGEPVVVGAVNYGLVVARDIDMEIYADEPTIEQGFSVMAEVARLPRVWQVMFVNELAGPDQGLYFKIVYRDDTGEEWKIDQWLVGHDHPDAHWCEKFARAIGAVLTDDSRRAILEIKEALHDEGVRGIDVYRGVIEGGVTTPLEFKAWQKSNPPDGMCHWMP
ncbi:MAG: hypothetical protein ABFD69_03085 [Candidatus Sumerlaeia bacterium]